MTLHSGEILTNYRPLLPQFSALALQFLDQLVLGMQCLPLIHVV